jgi:hypothetical protein
LSRAVTSATIDPGMEEATVELAVGIDCCIECAAKREYNRMVLRIMTADDPPTQDDEFRLNLVLEFLETADFSKLRGSDVNLDGTGEARCMLRRRPDGMPSVSVI